MVDSAPALQSGQWLTFTMNVYTSSIGYDGFCGCSTPNSAAWTALAKFRIQFVTASAGQEILAYVDNVVVTNE